MLRQLLLIAFAVFSFSTLAVAQKTPAKLSTTNTNTRTNSTTNLLDRDKRDVQNFGLSIVESYFRQDCDFAWTRFARSIQSIENGQVFEATPDLKTEFCNETPLRTDIAVTYRMYQDNYTQKIYSAAEIATMHPELHQRLQLQTGDFMFDGSQRKATTSTSVFRASDSARFIVRRKGTSWQIIAI